MDSHRVVLRSSSTQLHRIQTLHLTGWTELYVVLWQVLLEYSTLKHYHLYHQNSVFSLSYPINIIYIKFVRMDGYLNCSFTQQLLSVFEWNLAHTNDLTSRKILHNIPTVSKLCEWNRKAQLVNNKNNLILLINLVYTMWLSSLSMTKKISNYRKILEELLLILW